MFARVVYRSRDLEFRVGLRVPSRRTADLKCGQRRQWDFFFYLQCGQITTIGFPAQRAGIDMVYRIKS